MRLLYRAIIFFVVAIACKKNPPAKPSEKSISFFRFNVEDNRNFLSSDVYGNISNDTILLKVPIGTGLNNLVPEIGFTGKSVSPANKTAQNFTNRVDYTVTSEDGSIRVYKVIVRFLSNAKEISSFIFKSANNPQLTADIAGVISNDTIVVKAPSGLRLNELVPTIVYKGTSMEPRSNISQNFALPVNYTVYAEDVTSKKYTVFTGANRMVYFGCEDGNLYALDANSGGLIWKFNAGGKVSDPTISNGTVYFGASNGYFYAVDAANGNLKWSHFKWLKGYTIPLVQNGLVYFVGRTQGGILEGYHTLYALDASQGNVLFEKPVWRTLYGPTISNGTIFLTHFESGLNAYDALTGAFKWKYYEGILLGNPAVYNGEIYVGGETALTVTAVDEKNGSLKWRYGLGGQVAFSHTVNNGMLYFGTGVAEFSAFDISTRSLKWSTTVFANPQGTIFFSAPFVSGGMVFTGVGSGNLLALDAISGQKKWEKQVSSSSNANVPTVPVAANGVVFAVMGHTSLYALDGVSGAVKWTFTASSPLSPNPCVIDLNGKTYHTSNSGEQN